MTQPFDPAALRLLLPFYVNGTLTPGQRAELDAALAASPALRAELAALTALQQQVREQGAALTSSDDAREARLSALVEQLPAQERAAPPPPPRYVPPPAPSRLAAALALLTPGRWVPAVALSLALVVGMQSVALSRSRSDNAQLGTQLAQMTEKYQSASGPCDDAAKAGRIALELRDGATWAQIADLLDAEQLTIVSSGGFGTLTVASQAKDQALTGQIARLRKLAAVASADPAT